MAQELGRVHRPAAEPYQGKRKLLLVPLLYTPHTDDESGSIIVTRYWDQVSTQTGALEASLGGLSHVYCESLVDGGEEGLKYLKMADEHSHSLVQSKCEAGAVLESTEDRETLLEIVDLQRFLVSPVASQKVANRIQEWFNESNRGRYEHIAGRIDETLQTGETGLLLISERHQVQFPSDIEVFYVAPPALDEYRRWLQNWATRQQQPAADSDEAEPNGAEEQPEGEQVEGENQGEE